jgi:lipoprotein-releasing system permease protein
MNVWVILFLMLAVSGFNMISGLLILILERTNMIGILKSVGATDWSVRKIFLYHSFFLIGKGMLWGNAIGLALCTLQYFTGIIPLDPEAYYVATVPIAFNWLYIILLNAGTLVASLLMMIGPSYLITKITPAKIIRYE